MYTIEKLADGSREPILVIDFLTPTSEARISSKIAALGTGHPVYRIDPVSDISLLGYRGVDDLTAGYAEAWADIAGTGPVLLVSYCTAAPLGLRMAELLQKNAGAAGLLVDPSWPDLAMLASEYAVMRAKLRVDVSDDPLPALDEPRLHEYFEESIRRDLVAHLMKHGFSAEDANRRGAEFVARCMGWLGFLLAMSAADQQERSRFADVLRIPVAEVPDGAGPAFDSTVSRHIGDLVASMRALQP
ncbi:hypothetical protein [Actinoplanes derwentensis]|uniref:Uncharacterized protein n=1 Tax=Actinoplanes derwentensis TaxID=113562 RepID=A0A1H2CI07_9ACTN|nr:hypothetical protein [Actinoplanes derwentensis]GID89588.1 hypothetical protein Ade03nite_85120 [Actinoplanes derwentensis]SDT70170.1 hypothetical protein SAMN04489716_5899 [Actinoplanes derwentensis]